MVEKSGAGQFGPDTGFRYGSGSSETRGFDQDYRLTNVTDLGAVRRGLSRVLENLSYAYYPTNNVETITDAVTSTNSQSFSYDSLQRLSQAAGGYGSFGFTYDGDGNQLTQTLGAATTNYGYGSGSDQLATISVGGVATQALGYTADGRMASLNPGIQAPGSQYITSLSYNQNAQLSAVNAGSGSLASYTYDGFGQRLIKTVSGSYGEIYQYGQNGMLLEETNASGVAQADYIYLNGRPVAVLNGSALYYLHDDRLGTPQLATDSTQNIQWQASYEPFGTTPSVSGTITQNLRFPGQYFDVESGWNHNGFRDYLPALGRYAEPDPLGRLGSGNNLYVYVNDNPINFIDLLGLCTPCHVSLPSGQQLTMVYTLMGEQTPESAAGTQRYGDDQSGRNPGKPNGPTITDETLNLEAHVMAGTMLNLGNIGNAGTYLGLPQGINNTNAALKSANGSPGCIQLMRDIDAAQHPADTDFNHWKTTKQGNWVRPLNGGSRIAQNDFYTGNE